MSPLAEMFSQIHLVTMRTILYTSGNVSNLESSILKPLIYQAYFWNDEFQYISMTIASCHRQHLPCGLQCGPRQSAFFVSGGVNVLHVSLVKSVLFCVFYAQLLKNSVVFKKTLVTNQQNKQPLY